MLDCRAFGGQAGASARIENYLGFPTGITGMALMARAYNQAQKFGAEMAIPGRGDEPRPRDDGRPFHARVCESASAVRARSVVIASGARYRRLDVENLDAFEASSVHYWASPLEAKLCAGQEVALVGAGNSAGQAAVYLASQAAKVWMLVRGPDLGATMSRYLVDRIRGLANVEVVTGARSAASKAATACLEAVRWRIGATGEEVRRADPSSVSVHRRRTQHRLAAQLGHRARRQGFVLTGADAGDGRHVAGNDARGVFAIGDVRSGSVKRVAAAVGEGAQVVAALHAYLAVDSPEIEPRARPGGRVKKHSSRSVR